MERMGNLVRWISAGIAGLSGFTFYNALVLFIAPGIVPDPIASFFNKNGIGPFELIGISFLLVLPLIVFRSPGSRSRRLFDSLVGITRSDVNRADLLDQIKREIRGLQKSIGTGGAELSDEVQQQVLSLYREALG